MMEFFSLLMLISCINILATCVLYHNFIVSRGNLCFELNTEKIVYFPTTRKKFLRNKYIKTIFFLSIQLLLTLACLGLGYMGSHGQVDITRVLVSLLLVFISILLTSGTAIQVMHITPLGIYIATFLFFPFVLLNKYVVKMYDLHLYLGGSLYYTLLLIGVATVILWFLLLWIAGKIYEKVY